MAIPEASNSNGVQHRNGRDSLVAQVADMLGVEPTHVANVQPLTEAQSILRSKSHQSDTTHTDKFSLTRDADLRKLGIVCQEVVSRVPALRTCILTLQSSDRVQVLLTGVDTCKAKVISSLDHVLNNKSNIANGDGFASLGFTILDNSKTNLKFLSWTFEPFLVSRSLQEFCLRAISSLYDGASFDQLPELRALRPSVAINGVAVPNHSLQTLNGTQTSENTSAHARQSIRANCQPSQSSRFSDTILCQAALAVLLARYTGSSEVHFGLLAEKSLFLDGGQVHAEEAPHRAVSVDVQCDQTLEVSRLLHLVAENHEEAVLRNTAHISLPNQTGPVPFATQMSQAVLSVTRQDESYGPITRLRNAPVEFSTHGTHAEYPLILEYQARGSSSALVAHFDSELLEERQMMRFLRQFGRLVDQIRSERVSLVRELDALTEEDATEVNAWNSQELTTITGQCIHDLISKQVDAGPDRLAVSAWDGELTYSQLEDFSSRLAGYLNSLRLKEETIIPILSEKSRWVIVGLLGILKAGFAFTLLDCNTPRDRISRICSQVSATISVASREQSAIMRDLTQQCLVLDDDFIQSMPVRKSPLAKTKSTNLAYVLFTSGSTGEPKGIMIEHESFVSCSTVYGPAHGISRNTRALQFASYSFGACLVEIVTTLLSGGCVCVPSEDDRMSNIADYVQRAGVDWALLTPSFVRAIRPEDIPGIKTLVLAGEPITKDIQDMWASKVQLLYGYGQSETSTSCSLASVHPESKDLRNIGSGTGARLWINHPDDTSRLAPIGCEGELVVESPGVARGYLQESNSPPSPFLRQAPAWYPSNKPGPGRFYRTGDLAVYQSDGTISYVGRRDSQAKIRGHRIELGAVEACLRRHMSDKVALAVDIVEQPSSGGQVLVGFLSGYGEDLHRHPDTLTEEFQLLSPETVTNINDSLKSLLPPYSIPTLYVRVKGLPKTLTGKTDRKSLRQIGAQLIQHSRKTRTSESNGAPHLDSSEAEIFNAWQQCLGADTNTCSFEDSFFELGGDSIAAIRFVNVASSLGVTLNITQVFQNPTFSQLLSVIRIGKSSQHEPIPRSDLRGPVQQSYAQGRLWFLYQLHPDAPWYNTQVSTRLRGDLSIEALTTAIGALERRHETLRTTFYSENGEGMQVVHEYEQSKLRVIDIAEKDAHDLLRSKQRAPFSLASEPGWRVSLLRLDSNDYILSIVMHHIISDGWSVDLIARELRHLYRKSIQGQDLSEHIDSLPIQYRDFAVWQREEKRLTEQNRQLEYWKNQLADNCAAEFLADHPRPAMLSGNAGLEQFWVKGNLYSQLGTFCRRHQITPFVVLLAAFRAAHFRLTAEEDATVGTPIANRSRKETENLIGFFVNTQCMRITVSDGMTFVELVKKTEDVTGAAFAHQDVPFEQIVSALLPSSLRDTSRNPLVQVMFAVHSQKNLGTVELDGLESEFVPPIPTTRFDLELHMFQEEGSLRGDFLFSTDLFGKETVSSIIKVFQRILSRGIEESDLPVSCFALAEEGPDNLIDMEVTGYPRDSNVVDEFRRHAESTPESVAVRDTSRQMSYRELDLHSDRVASWLSAQSLTAESVIGVLAPRSCETIVAFLGILKAGLAYVPLDVNVVTSRNEAILASLPRNQKKLVLVGSGTPNPWTNNDNDIETMLISDAMKLPSLKPERCSNIGPDSLAYVMFTSGSTGKPKGVMIEHRSILRLVLKSNVMENVPSRAKIAHLSNLAFDASTWEIYGALLNGGTLVYIDHMTVLDSKALGARIQAGDIQAAMFPTALFKQCLTDIPDAIGTMDVVLVAGDRLDKREAIAGNELVQKALYNAYGPTENGVLTTIYKVDSQDEMTNGVPIGEPVSNTAVYIMDQHQQIVPAGVIGELVVSGDGLARGYTDHTLNDRFAEVTISGKAVRVYRTGDKARRRPSDRVIEFFGRMDRQLKIRGHRVELAEIEHVMTGDELIDAAAIVVCTDSEDQDQMIAFAAVHDDHLDLPSVAGQQQVEGWATHFDTSTYQTIDSIDTGEVGTDFTGWTSMYDGTEIDKDEMREWLRDTMSSLLDGQRPGRVFEIGTGTGMVLFNLANKQNGYADLDQYVGLDPSPSAVAFVNERLKLEPDLLAKAEVHVGAATDPSMIQDFRPDLVVINSVAQYFPSGDYLLQVVEELARQPGVRRIFFGDMRSYPLNRHFLAERALRTLGHQASKQDIIRHMVDLEEQEEELLVDPTFFTNLTSTLSGLVTHVEILPKRMAATNELSAYRYAAVIHLSSTLEPVREVPGEAWTDVAGSRLDKESLRDLLSHQKNAGGATNVVAVKNIPNSRNMLGRHITDMLDLELTGPGDPIDLSAANRSSSLSAADLIDMGKELGFRVELSWAQQRSSKGALDAIFHRMSQYSQEQRVLFRFPEDTVDGTALTNRPGCGSARRRVQSKIKDRLHRMLPSYMIPSQVIILDKLPLNSNGKIDRRHLLQLAQTATTKRSRNTTRSAPQSQIEAFLCKEFTDVLGVDVGADDSFFDLGGHSLMATKLAARINKRLNVDISVRDIFLQPTITGLLSTVSLGSARHDPIIPTELSGPARQSFAQGRLWFLHQLNPSASWYNMPLAVRLRGSLSVDALGAALSAIQQRHEALRTTFQDKDGMGVQIVQPHKPQQLRIVDVSSGSGDDFGQILKNEQATPFSLTSEPGWRVLLLRLGEQEHILSIVMHHIVSDGWSIDVLAKELQTLYSAALHYQDPLSSIQPLPIQYHDFSSWQRQEKQRKRHDDQLKYWVHQLEDSSPAYIMCDRSRPAILSGKADVIRFAVAGTRYQQLHAFCQNYQVTPFTALLAAFRATNYRLTGSQDATIGTPVANRNREELENMIGFFVNTQCMRITVRDEDSLETLVQQVQVTAAAAFANQDVPFEKIVSAVLPGTRDLSRNPLVQVMFAVHSQQNLGKVNFENLDAELIHPEPTTRFDLEVHFFQEEQQLRAEVIFSTDLFERGTVSNLAMAFQEIVDRGLEDPRTPVSCLAMTYGLSEARQMNLLERMKADYPRESSIVDVFRTQVKARPEAIAVKGNTGQVTYSELDHQSDTIASWLCNQEFRPESVVGVFAPRSRESTAAFLGILKAGLAYLPLDVNITTSRNEAILSSLPEKMSAGGLVLIGAGASDPWVKNEIGIKTRRIADILADQSLSVSWSKPSAGPNSLAYVIFTSGSTGKPKGVMVEHRSVLRLVVRSNVMEKIPALPNIAHLSNLAFDAAVWEIYGALLNGGKLVCIDYLTAVDKALGAALQSESIHAAFLTTALLKQCLVEIPVGLRCLDVILAGGERLDPSDAVKAQGLVRSAFYNVYGPTENCVFSTLWEVSADEGNLQAVPIGETVSNTGALILNRKQEVVSAGVLGELVVTGDGLARGYTDRSLDADRFVDIMLNGVKTRAYRTGDQARWRPKDGAIEFFGRLDRQVKIRGHRVEPEEIEHILAADNLVDATAVIVCRDEVLQEDQLVAFATVRESSSLHPAEETSQQQVEGWTMHFENNTYEAVDAITTTDVGQDFMGWTSMYDGTTIDKVEMHEWLDDTVTTLLDGQGAGKVLEIGTGTGMILFNLGSGLEKYVGIDPSTSAVAFVKERIMASPDLADKAEVHVGTAMDASHLCDFEPDLVIINSVAQYFPSPEYLYEVTEALVRLPGVRRIFFGDMRSLPLDRGFLCQRALHSLGNTASKQSILQKVSELEEQEEELLVDPSFFTSLTDKLPVKHVEVIPKRMKATNELSAYRYAAVVHVEISQPVHTLDPTVSSDFKDVDSLRRRLESAVNTNDTVVAICNIPNSKIALGRSVAEMLDLESRAPSDSIDWSTVVQQATPMSLSASDIADIGKEFGLRVELSWARQRSTGGSLDAVFHRTKPDSSRRTLFQFPVDSPVGVPLTNRPGRRSTKQLLQSQIRERAQKLLPPYMIPSRVIVVDELPLNRNGKIDRQQLLRMAKTAPSHLALSIPATPLNEVEALLCDTFTEVLGVKVSNTDNFFDLGGHSLIATRLAARINQRLKVNISVRDVFDRPRLADLSVMIRRGSSHHHPIQPTEVSDPVTQSYAQGRLWFLYQLNPAASWYNMPFAIRLRGNLSLKSLAAAIDALEKRHETLRTTFHQEGGDEFQVIHDFAPKKLRVVDAQGDEFDSQLQQLRSEQTAPFSLASEPGWRVSLIRLTQDDHILSIVMHHIISDGWSVDILGRELEQFYSASLQGEQDPSVCVAPLSIQYRDFAVWQRQQDQMDEHRRQLEYWKAHLTDSSPAEFLADRARPSMLSGKADIARFFVEGVIYDRLQEFCRTHQVTPFIVLLSAFRASHYRLTGAEDATVGTPIANRNREELEGIIGFFVNTQCMRVVIRGNDMTFADLIETTKSTAGTAFANQDVPFEQVVSALLPGSRDASRNPLVQVMFAVHSQQNLGKIRLQGLESEFISPVPTTRFDLEMHLFQEQDQLRGDLMFSTDLFETETIKSITMAFQEVLRRGLDEPQAKIKEMPLVDGVPTLREKGFLDIVAHSAEYPRDASVVDVFRRQARITPDAVAVDDSSRTVTYAQLDYHSDKIASWLHIGGFATKPESVVAVLVPRSCEAIVAFLGVLKACLAYLPLDVRSTTSRNESILSSLPDTRLILVGSGVSNVPTVAIRNVQIADILSQHTLPDQWALNALGPSADSLAYLTFTSGSTGKPKGVMVEHRSILRLVAPGSNVMEHIPEDATIAHLSNLAFDAAVWEIYAALLNGGTLVCIDYMSVVNLSTLGVILETKKVNAAFLPTALLKQCLVDISHSLAGLDVILAGGERMDSADAIKAQGLTRAAFYNIYGPTENCVFSTLWQVKPDDRFVQGVPIGYPVSGTAAYVMDQQQLVSPGIMGELVVAGEGIARGYTDPELNSGRFVEVTVEGKTVRAYRTGDRVRQRPTDGAIEFFGRLDRQIKIRGHRVEPAEVEHVIAGDQIVDSAAVLTSPSDLNGQDQMVAFATIHNDRVHTADGLDQQVEGWAAHFEQSTYETIATINEVGNDFMGWTSMYDGSKIDKAEMEQWLQDTLATLLDGQPAGNVLEIGTGTGMILFNLGSGLDQYVGLDPSASAVAFVRDKIKATPSLTNKAHVHVGTATDLDVVHASHPDFRPDVVVVNSVAQYFPSAEYLGEAVNRLIRLPGLKRLFLGDIRSHPLNQSFLAQRALHSLDGNATKEAILHHMTELEEQEEELLIDPAVFTKLATDFPDLVSHVEILPKRMKATNELSAYRYAAVIHIGSFQPRHEVRKDSWINFEESSLNAGLLRRHLQNMVKTNNMVAVSNITNPKTLIGNCINRMLDQEDDPENNKDWSSTARDIADHHNAMSALELVALGSELGLQVELSWARQRSSKGALDAIFHTLGSTNTARVLFQFPTDSSNVSLTNQPGRRSFKRSAQSKIKDRLSHLLPLYMIPSQIIILDRMPMNNNGKVDRHELQQQLKKKSITKGKQPKKLVAPRNKTEALLCENFTAVLGVEASVTDNFFDLGGHSLMGTKLAARISRRLNVDLSVKDIFDKPRILDLANGLTPDSALGERIKATKLQGPVRQSYAQGRLWFLHQLDPDALGYTTQLATRLRGPLSIKAVTAALHALEKRHEILRTTFKEQGGVGMQIVYDHRPEPLRVIDVPSGKDYDRGLLRAERKRPLDLSSEPGWRVCLLRLGQNHHILSIVMHHIVYDGWSIDIIVRELRELYKASLRGKDNPLQPLPVQYRDYSIWQRTQAQVALQQKQLEYWKEQLADSSAAEFLSDRKRPATLSGSADIQHLSISGPIYTQLKHFCRQQQVTPFIVLLTAFRVAHYRLTGDRDATIGTPIANRNHDELQNLVGFFVNTQCMRIVMEEGDTDFTSLVQKVRVTAGEAFANQEVPFEQIVSAVQPRLRSPSRTPLVQVMFAVHDDQRSLGKVNLEGLESSAILADPTSRFDLEMHVFNDSEKEELRVDLVYSTDLFDPETVSGIAMTFKEVIQGSLEESQVSVSCLPLTEGIPELQSKGLLDSSTANHPQNSSVVDIFRQQARANPDAIAVRDHSAQMTYSELDHQSDKIAAWLTAQSMPAESLIGVLAARSCEAITAFLGIMKANLAYLPLDANAVTAREDSILSSLPGKRLILVESSMAGTSFSSGITVETKKIADVLSEYTIPDSWYATAPNPTSSSLAYVLFTSGSTGRPKGVMIEHRSIVRLVINSNVVEKIPPRPRISHLSNLAFDASVFEIYAALLNGGTIVCIDYLTVVDTKALAVTFGRERINAAMIPTALFKQCLADAPDMFTSVDVVFAAGDRLDRHDAFRGCKLVRTALYNAYGPTENGVLSTIYEVQDEEMVNGVPIGRSVSGTTAYIMDQRQQIVSPGVIGELVVAGYGVSRGYTNPELDANRFVVVIVNGKATKVYRTGDLARWRPTDGLIEFFGRMDRQVKIHGHRVEPAEVERVIANSQLVDDCAVMVRESDSDGREIIAFVSERRPDATAQGGADSQPLSELEVKSYLRTCLPPYMIPARVPVLDRLPTNANGKVDRQKLAQMAQTLSLSSGEQTRSLVAPRNEVEALLCEAFSRVLGTKVSITDNFFDIGGHSLVAVELLQVIRTLGFPHMSLRDIFDYPVLHHLATKLSSSIPKSGSAATPDQPSLVAPFQLMAPDHRQIVKDGHVQKQIRAMGHPRARVVNAYPATGLQRVFLDDTKTGSPRPPITFFANFPSGLDCERLQKGWSALIQHFDILRTTFVPIEGEMYQVVCEELHIPIDIIKVGSDADSPTQALRKHDLEHGLQLGDTFLRVAILEQEGLGAVRTVLRISHALYDGISLRYLAAALNSLCSGVTALPPTPQFVQYVQHAADNRTRCQEYWADTLRGSSMSFLPATNPGREARGTHEAKRTIPTNVHRGAIPVTQATIFTAACALTIADATNLQDVVFGRVVSGREALPTNYQGIVGPCTNDVPVRLQIDDDTSKKGLLRKVQDQYLNSLPYQTLGFEELRSHCTDWSDDVRNYGCCVSYQHSTIQAHNKHSGEGLGFEYFSGAGDGVESERSGADGDVPIHEVEFVAFPREDQQSLEVMLVVGRQVCGVDGVGALLDTLCGHFATLVSIVESGEE